MLSHHRHLVEVGSKIGCEQKFFINNNLLFELLIKPTGCPLVINHCTLLSFISSLSDGVSIVCCKTTKSSVPLDAAFSTTML